MQPRSQGVCCGTLGRIEGPGNGWLSHDQIFQYSWKIFLATSWVLNFCNKFSKYIKKFGHVTTSLCEGLCPPHASLQRGPGNEVGSYAS